MPDTKLIQVPISAVQRVIDYLIEDEKEEWEANHKPNNHIYLALRELELYLAGEKDGA